MKFFFTNITIKLLFHGIFLSPHYHAKVIFNLFNRISISLAVSTFYLTSLVGVSDPLDVATNCTTLAPLVVGGNETLLDDNCVFQPPETAVITKIGK